MKIFINPGHGGNDPGACANNLRESDIALNIGKRVADYLRAVGYDVNLFQFDGLGEICNTSDNWHSDLFVSIHCNAGGGSGSEIYCYGATAGKVIISNSENKRVIDFQRIRVG